MRVFNCASAALRKCLLTAQNAPLVFFCGRRGIFYSERAVTDWSVKAIAIFAYDGASARTDDTNSGFQNAAYYSASIGYLPPQVVQNKILPFHGSGNGLSQGKSEWSKQYSNKDALVALAQQAVANGQEIQRGIPPGNGGNVYVWYAPGAGTDFYEGATNRYVVYTEGTTIDIGIAELQVQVVTNMFPRATGY